MWQSLDMNAWAKSYSSSCSGSSKPQAVIAAHLRDFSNRLLPDDRVEILPPDSAQKDDDYHEEQADTPQMQPFTLEQPQENDEEVAAEIDLESIRRQAFEAGRQSLVDESRLERERLVEAHRQTLNEARQTLINSMAGDLLAACQAGFETVQTSLEQDIAQLIAALIGEKWTNQAIADFVQKLAQESLETSLPLIIEGKQPLLDAFIVQAKADPNIDLERYQLKVNETDELRLVHQKKVLSTRLAPLLQQLREMI